MTTACTSSVLKRLDKLPALSPMVMRLVHELGHRNADGKHLADLIEKDAVLCAQVLKVANSAMYARAGQIASVRQAVAFLGFNKLRRLVLGFSFSSFFGRMR